MTEDLDVRLQTTLPETLAVGRGASVFLYGSCFHRHQRVRRIRILVDGEAVEPMAQAMPRLDLFQALHPLLSVREEAELRQDPSSEDDPEVNCYRSGFWGIVPLEAPKDGPRAVELAIEAKLADGSTVSAVMASPRVVEQPEEPPVAQPESGTSSGEELIAICMATYNPDPELFREQVESIRAQTHENWVCLISDDQSRPAAFAEIEALVGDDPRFVVSRSQRRLGFYRNFERALRMAPADAAHVALADQDDRWYPEKLAVLREEIGAHKLVYSDARIVSRKGESIAETYWTKRTPNHTNLASLLIANTVTGAASLMRRDLLELGLPFPETPGVEYHDHWLALVALATGSIGFVDRPLYDYVQHGGAVLGHAAVHSSRRRRIRGDGSWRAFFLGWRTNYFHSYIRLGVLARTLLLRAEGVAPWRRRRSLRRFLSADRGVLGMAWLALRGLRPALGINDTAGAERGLLEGVLWRRILRAINLGKRHPGRRLRHDASIPQTEGGSRARFRDAPATKQLREAIAPLELSVSESAPERVNLLVPEIDLKHLFGGYITLFNLAGKLADRGARIRIVTVAPSKPLPRAWQKQVEAYNGLEGLFDRVEVAFARDRDRPLEVNPDDSFIATAWWTAHAAHQAVSELRRDRFLYLIQEFEPFVFPMGPAAALAMQTYRFPHFAMFSTELLRSYFASQGEGVFAAGSEAGDRDSISFQNAITPVKPPTAEAFAEREGRLLLFYARPEAHAARNMFELGLMALTDAVAEGAFAEGWRFHGIGTVEGGDRFELGEGAFLELQSRRDQSAYAELLASADVGLGLMCTPHPSLVPIEMASAGMLTVTNSFGVKTPEAMAAISSNLITREPTLDGIVEGLLEAVARCDDIEARISGARVEWSSDWDRSFDDSVMGQVMDFLRRS